VHDYYRNNKDQDYSRDNNAFNLIVALVWGDYYSTSSDQDYYGDDNAYSQPQGKDY
jgi:hypothetical protein